MRADALNWHGYGGYMKMTALSSNVFSTNEDRSKLIIMHKNLLQSCSVNEDKSKQSIVNKTLSQKYSTDVDKWFSTEKYKSKFTIMEQKDSENEVTYNVPYNLTSLT